MNLDDVQGDFASLGANTTYWYDIDGEDSTSLCVLFTVPAEGWQSFLGTYKDRAQDGRVMERVTAGFPDVTNLTVDACKDQTARDPAVGPSVDDLVAALTELPPFEIVSPPTDVSVYGYSGKHIRLRIPSDLPSEHGGFDGCGGGDLRTWIAPQLSFAYYGYLSPGDTEDFWILQVDRSRLVISALTSATASPELVAERQAVLDSIVIMP